MVWTCKENARKQTATLKILEWEPEGTRKMGRPKQRWLDGVRRRMTNHGQKRILETETDRETWFWVKENHCRVDKPLDDDDYHHHKK
jgi:hypothetical protein